MGNETIPRKLDGGLWLSAPVGAHPNLVWREPFEFEADMKLVGYQKTNRGDFFLWADEATNATFPMSPKELYDALIKSMPEDGRLSGLWDVVESRQRFSLRLVEEMDPIPEMD